MLFLKPLYLWVAAHYATRINHFPLITLIFQSIDKTIFYLLIFLILRWVWRGVHHKRLHWGQELRLVLLVTYLLLLFNLTVFRDAYFPWDLQLYWHRPLSVINWRPLVETVKLTEGASMIDFWYQSLGNVLWFMPLGFLWPLVHPQKSNWGRMFFVAVCFSLSIEALQFVLNTGVTDIDDVIFNTLGGVLGYLLLPKKWIHAHGHA
ncbi:VanZ family protein [Lacticaseibacillus brantae]|uniref:Glycopeptide antibiotics resistance protein n=1 Tax=Lacticaseibacillus brantae DSM 23927 TaxID=1423727 RepID=A0A0R2BB24_9LACO|nr:VanZ family protein [Lacticaseibacillus brantae]KRM72988.1 glycopeptide antibiotics resistance protein [Lacticaseibacillus brantae DSM 23927]